MAKKKKASWNEFECPTCEATNPVPDAFSGGDNVVCMWCGIVWLVKEVDEERFSLVED